MDEEVNGEDVDDRRSFVEDANRQRVIVCRRRRRPA